jgi:osmotically-inducible protein OsmY
MTRKRSGKSANRKHTRRRGPAISRRTIKRDEDTTQLLERGEGPTADEQVDPGVESPSEITTEGGPGTDSSYRLGGPARDPGERANRGPGGARGTGGGGGYSTLGGGVYPDEGAPEDAPRYGDWQRHSSGATSGARGQEGFGFPGERTWGEEQYQEQDSEDRRESPVRRPDESLAREIHEILTKDPELDATDIEVEVEDGAVTLTGAVNSTDAKLLAEELVESLPGVRHVHNRLTGGR